MCSCGKSQCERYKSCGYPPNLRYKPVTHCIFDLDGTLMDSESIYHDMITEICKSYGKTYPSELRQRLYGATDRHVCETLVQELKVTATVPELEERLASLGARRLPQAPLQPGVERLVRHLVARRVPLAIATNSTRHEVDNYVKARPRFFAKFHHLVSVTDIQLERGKPCPDLYLRAAAQFPDAPEPAKCLVFEDTYTGLQAGVAAGMQVILTPHNGIDHKQAKTATLILRSLLDFRPELFGLPPFDDKWHPHQPPYCYSWA